MARYGVSFLLKPEPAEALPLLTAPGSPLTLRQESDAEYIFTAKDPVLEGHFILSATTNTSPEREPYATLDDALGIAPAAAINHEMERMTIEKGHAFKSIGAYLARARIPFYTVLRDEVGGLEPLYEQDLLWAPGRCLPPPDLPPERS